MKGYLKTVLTVLKLQNANLIIGIGFHAAQKTRQFGQRTFINAAFEINHFLADVGRALGAGIHARTLIHWLEAF